MTQINDLVGKTLAEIKNGQPTLQQHFPVSSSAFEPVHCQKDYLTDTVTVQFRGQFNGVKAWEYLKQSYPSFEGREIVHFEEPSNFRGLENLGTAVFQHCP